MKTYLGRVGGRAGTTRRRACAVPARGAAAQSPSGEQPSGGGKILAALGREKVVLKTVQFHQFDDSILSLNCSPVIRGSDGCGSQAMGCEPV